MASACMLVQSGFTEVESQDSVMKYIVDPQPPVQDGDDSIDVLNLNSKCIFFFFLMLVSSTHVDLQQIQVW